jgi:hypothetical protein
MRSLGLNANLFRLSFGSFDHDPQHLLIVRTERLEAGWVCDHFFCSSDLRVNQYRGCEHPGEGLLLILWRDS